MGIMGGMPHPSCACPKSRAWVLRAWRSSGGPRSNTEGVDTCGEDPVLPGKECTNCEKFQLTGIVFSVKLTTNRLTMKSSRTKESNLRMR